MTYKLVCKDLGLSCPFVAEGKTRDEMMAVLAKHAKEVHGFTEEQLNDPTMQKKY